MEKQLPETPGKYLEMPVLLQFTGEPSKSREGHNHLNTGKKSSIRFNSINKIGPLYDA